MISCGYSNSYSGFGVPLFTKYNLSASFNLLGQSAGSTYKIDVDSVDVAIALSAIIAASPAIAFDPEVEVPGSQITLELNVSS